MIPKLIRSYELSAAVGANLIVAFSDAANSRKVAGAASATAAIIGTTDRLGGDTGDMADITLSGLGDVKLGGTVAAGDPLTSDANSKAIKATVDGQRIVGFADAPGVLNDVIPYLCAPGVLSV